jgi:DNA-binding winged helix-turn-helix (wHTH) protein
MSFEKVPIFLLNFFEADMNGINTPSYRFQAFLLDVAERQFFQSGKLVPLTPKAFDVLAYLVANAGHLVLKDDLMQAVWPDSFVDEVNLPRTVHTLRRALGEGEGENKFIETIPTKGYRFVANVTIIDREEHTSESADVGPEFINSPEADGGSGMGTIRRFWFSPTVVVSVIFLLIVGVAGSYLFRSKESTTKTDGRRSIAVLPFEVLNRSGRPR